MDFIRKSKPNGTGTMLSLSNASGVEVAYIYPALETKTAYYLESPQTGEKRLFDRQWQAKKAARELVES